MEVLRAAPHEHERWAHWKHGCVYRIVCVSRDEPAPHAVRVAYKREDAPSDEIPWSRTLEDFMSTVPAERVHEELGELVSLPRFRRLP